MSRVLPSTGYRYAYPFLDSSGLELDTSDNHAAPLYKHVFPPAAAPSLAFVGLLWKSLRYIQFEMQVPQCVITQLGSHSLLWVGVGRSGREHATLADSVMLPEFGCSFSSRFMSSCVEVPYAVCTGEVGGAGAVGARPPAARRGHVGQMPLLRGRTRRRGPAAALPALPGGGKPISMTLVALLGGLAPRYSRDRQPFCICAAIIVATLHTSP